MPNPNPATLQEKLVVAKGCIFLIAMPIIMWLMLVRIGQQRLYDKASGYSSRLSFNYSGPSGNLAECEDGRLLAAEIAADADFSWNAFHEFAHWNTDYLAQQPKCGGL